MSNPFIQVVAKFLSRLTRYAPVRRTLQQLLSAYKSETVLAEAAPGFEIPEILPLLPKASSVSPPATRLNLLVPAVSPQHVFGGIATALQVFDVLRTRFEHARIVVTDEVSPVPGAATYYGDWPVLLVDQESIHPSHIVAAGSRWGKQLAVHQNDFFISTAWWTAQMGFALLDWQQKTYAGLPARRLCYLIQDYEPGFYPWSSRYVMAQASYAKPQQTVALINSMELAGYLSQQGHQFDRCYVLHPRLNPHLMAVRQHLESFTKERVLLVYGRPGTDRNAFTLLLAALKYWVHLYPAAGQWQVLSAGESFEPIELGDGCQLRSLGKLSIDAYAQWLQRTAVGLSLMVSPHPSYPPLEMAAFGVHVVTNGFANKDLSVVSSFIHSVSQPEPVGLAQQLLELTEDFERKCAAARTFPVSSVDWHEPFFLNPSESVPDWKEPVAQALLSTQ